MVGCLLPVAAVRKYHRSLHYQKHILNGCVEPGLGLGLAPPEASASVFLCPFLCMCGNLCLLFQQQQLKQLTTPTYALFPQCSIPHD